MLLEMLGSPRTPYTQGVAELFSVLPALNADLVEAVRAARRHSATRVVLVDVTIRKVGPFVPGRRHSTATTGTDMCSLGPNQALQVRVEVCEGTNLRILTEWILECGPRDPATQLPRIRGRRWTRVRAEHVAVRRLDPNLPARFAAAHGDDNPIHVDDASAIAAGFRTRVVHGMCLLAISALDLASVIDAEATTPTMLQARFYRPVYIDETISTEYQRVAQDAYAMHIRTTEGIALRGEIRVARDRS